MIKQDYYVYIYLREDGTPYYVGKGHGKRYLSGDKRVKVPPVDRIIIPLINLTEEQAFQNEIDYILFYGRKDNATGILRNLTNGGEGASGTIVSKETRDKLSSYAKNRTEKHKKKLIISNTGKKRSESQRETFRNASKKFYENGGRVWNKGLKKDDPRVLNNTKKRIETIQKNKKEGKLYVAWNKGKKSTIPPWNKGLKKDDPRIIALSEKRKKQNRELNLTCPHCGKKGGQGAMHRWHFDNCKFKNSLSNFL